MSGEEKDTKAPRMSKADIGRKRRLEKQKVVAADYSDMTLS